MNRKVGHHIVVAAALVLGTSLLLTLVLLFGWNLFAPDIFGAARMEFRHALGIVLVTFIAGRLLLRPRRCGRVYGPVSGALKEGRS